MINVDCTNPTELLSAVNNVKKGWILISVSRVLNSDVVMFTSVKSLFSV